MTTDQPSDRRLAANRENARKSTGPRTPEGKDRSRRNALKHGLLARTILLNEADPHENPADFDHLLAALHRDLAPADSLQAILVERIAACTWRFRRAYRYEAQAIENARRDQRRPISRALDEIAGHPEPPPDDVLPHVNSVNKLVRYENMIEREFDRSLNHLRRLQRPTPPPPPCEPDPLRAADQSRERRRPVSPTSPSRHQSEPGAPATGLPHFPLVPQFFRAKRTQPPRVQSDAVNAPCGGNGPRVAVTYPQA